MNFASILIGVISLFTFTSAGPVNVSRCEGFGTPIETRISDCDGYCTFIPGRVYNAEQDFMPSAATPSLTLKVEICMSAGFCMQIFEVELPGSSVQPGFVYTSKYSVVPNDILAGQTVQMRAQISHTDTRRVDVCIYCDVDIAALK
ncbi:uncharacterized protein LOC110846792 [Folsomia candida]|uniref:Uncharacterized protein n=1 Tax=Folsomia candida TaxID=158441 RepID=A0A226EL67_FOLCA|nr:uncharacterized protein LOC110846792 [Folsomia candida]OXA57958.1 hypothetical protein Fcan01_07180 [Folsomia candida]